MAFPAVQFLADLIRIKSVTSDIANVNKSVEFVSEALRKAGCFCSEEVFDHGRKALWASNVEGQIADLVLVVHLDVVPAPDEMFEPLIDGDAVIGRGANDCKGNVVSAITALLEINEAKDEFVSVGIILSTDEEIGGDTTRGFVERGYRARKAALTLDCDDGTNIVVAQKGIAVLRLTAYGKGGHAAAPWECDNPISKLFSGVMKLQEHWGKAWQTSDGTHWRNTVALCAIEGGSAHNKIPDEASATLNVRFIENFTPECIAEEARQVSGLKVEILATSPCIAFPVDSPHMRKLREIMREHFPGHAVEFTRANGATDARHLLPWNVPVAIFGVTGEGCHSAREEVSAASIRIIADVVKSFARELSKI